MVSRQTMGAAFVALLCTSLVTSTIAASMDAQEVLEGRKFVTKSNNVKKNPELRAQSQPQNRPNQPPAAPAKTEVANDGGFQWGNIFNVVMQVLFGGPVNGPDGSSDKMDYITQLTTGEFSWAKMVSLGVQMVLNVLGGGDNAAIDKMDSGSPVEGILTAVISYLTGSNNPEEVGVMAKQASELFGLVVTLLDALRTSFSERSFQARSMGSSDPVADAAVAATTMVKTYIKTYETEDDICMQKYLCEANTDCVLGTGDTGYLFCQIGTYGMSYLLERSTYTPFEIFNDAGRRGRVGENCKAVFSECNHV
ncbi:uncharacterized protein LOC126994139 isoform X2 [Eriocheir sinensis]|uniref:uncharacterized protein LOC126994139 isoform X2 n=1 Tax=Eriocheir sinensis TaxID=95602 RepID=UPI0021C9703A|nr:uncharacterized protein LOC126994139 isoform X2 [Eriocheir sinensis]